MATVVTVKNLTYAYPDGRRALQDISFSLEAGETVALIGPNGAGKSTLLLQLIGILRGQGAINILGRPLNDDNLNWIRRQVGLVFQNPDDQLFSPTVFDDVAFGPLNLGLPIEEVRVEVERALKWVGMSGFETRAPYHLSLGEKKRVAIASVLSMTPQLLVLDEPTANLDPRGKGELVRLLQQLPMAKIVATHDLDTVRHLCPRTLVLDGGQLVADDTTARILGNTELLQAHSLTSDPGSKILAL